MPRRAEDPKMRIVRQFMELTTEQRTATRDMIDVALMMERQIQGGKAAEPKPRKRTNSGGLVSSTEPGQLGLEKLAN